MPITEGGKEFGWEEVWRQEGGAGEGLWVRKSVVVVGSGVRVAKLSLSVEVDTVSFSAYVESTHVCK